MFVRNFAPVRLCGKKNERHKAPLLAGLLVYCLTYSGLCGDDFGRSPPRAEYRVRLLFEFGRIFSVDRSDTICVARSFKQFPYCRVCSGLLRIHTAVS